MQILNNMHEHYAERSNVNGTWIIIIIAQRAFSNRVHRHHVSTCIADIRIFSISWAKQILYCSMFVLVAVFGSELYANGQVFVSRQHRRLRARSVSSRSQLPEPVTIYAQVFVSRKHRRLRTRSVSRRSQPPELVTIYVKWLQAECRILTNMSLAKCLCLLQRRPSEIACLITGRLCEQK